MRSRSQSLPRQAKAKRAASPSAAPKKAEKRVRRSAVDARRLILDAAEKRLAHEGPEGIRLQDIAADVGISHPAVLHHFESREGLVRALIERSERELRDKLFALLNAEQTGLRGEDIIAKVFEIMSDRGTARLIAWLNMTGRSITQAGSQNMVMEIAERVHEERMAEARAEGRPPPKKEETLFMALLVASAAIGDAIIGPQLAASASLDKAGIQRFRRWIATVLRAGERRG
jgi:AcrR family transcriptional regulator